MLELRAGSARARIAAHGAELKGWSVAGRELMWEAGAVWPQTAPVLFPVVGWSRNGVVRIGGASFPMGVHGFAAQTMFSPVSITPDHVRLEARDDEATRAHYPFAFRLTLDYALTQTQIRSVTLVENTGDAPMPYACGLHPGFRWPFAGGAAEDYAVLFDRDERTNVPVIAPGGLISPRTKMVTLQDGRLALRPDLFAIDALAFLDARSQSVTFTNGAAAIIVARENYPHVALWSRGGAPFLCIESWTSHSDVEGFCGELAQRPFMRVLAPGARARHAATYAWRAG